MSASMKGPFKTNSKIVLASGSPRRRELLKDIGLEFDVHPSTLDEPRPEAGEDSIHYAKRMAEMKTRDVAHNYRNATVLGADTIVVLDNQIMGKPQDEEDALKMLTNLSGKTHQVVSAFCIVLPDGQVITQAVSTDVDMRASGVTKLKSYIATGEPMDKAGAYAIQGVGTFMVTGIRGSYTNVVGLPLARVVEELLALNIISAREI